MGSKITVEHGVCRNCPFLLKIFKKIALNFGSNFGYRYCRKKQQNFCQLEVAQKISQNWPYFEIHGLQILFMIITRGRLVVVGRSLLGVIASILYYTGERCRHLTKSVIDSRRSIESELVKPFTGHKCHPLIIPTQQHQQLPRLLSYFAR